MRYSLKFKVYAPVLITILVIVANSVYANTTIVAMRTEKAVFIGTDSKAVPLPIVKCKIQQAGDIFVAFSGMPAYSAEINQYPFRPRQEEIFDAYKIIREIGLEKSPIAVKVDRFETVLRNALPPILEGIRQTNDDYFCTKILRGNNNVLTAVIAGIGNNIPVFYIREVRITTRCGEPVAIEIDHKNYVGHIAPEATEVNLSGEFEAIMKELPERITHDKIVEIINEWITLEIITRPDIVGPPIDILRITNKGAEWIQHKPECKDIK